MICKYDVAKTAKKWFYFAAHRHIVSVLLIKILLFQL